MPYRAVPLVRPKCSESNAAALILSPKAEPRLPKAGPEFPKAELRFPKFSTALRGAVG